LDESVSDSWLAMEELGSTLYDVMKRIKNNLFTHKSGAMLGIELVILLCIL
jgi:hypothetical protein